MEEIPCGRAFVKKGGEVMVVNQRLSRHERLVGLVRGVV